jgi:dUTP pyrophosphatase
MRLNSLAKLPTRGSIEAAGLDLYSSQGTIIPSKSRGAVKTDIAVQIPQGYYGRLAPRSGLARNKGIDVGAGVVDSDYRGEVQVVLFNHGEEDFIVEVGDRICQLLVIPVLMLDVEDATHLEDTARGEQGFGSSGV